MNYRSKYVLLLCSALVSPAFIASAAHAQASGSSFTYATRFDAERRVTGSIAPDPDGSGPINYAAVRNTYNAAGRLTKVEKGELASWQSESVAPSAWTGFTVYQTVDTSLDAIGRKVKETLKGNSGSAIQTVTQFNYDAVGRLKCTAVRMDPAQWASQSDACDAQTTGGDGPDRITKNIYDDAGQLLQIREGVDTNIEATEATLSYTLNGKREFVIDGEGNKAKFVYDGHDRLTQWQFPSKTKPTAFNDSTPANALSTAGAVSTTDREQYEYDANGNRTRLTRRDGSVIDYTFDKLNRMATKDLPSTAGDVTYGYDLRGLQLTAAFTSGGQGITNAYNGFGDLTSSASNVGGTSRTLTNQYDAHGNRTRITHPDGKYFETAYDQLDRATDIYLTNATATMVPIVYITYDAAGRRNDVHKASASTLLGYDSGSRLSTLFHDFAGTGNEVTTAFTYNPASQIKTASRDNDAFAWTGHGNGSTATVVNGLNQIATKAGGAFTYDANGNLTSDGATTFVYDKENRLTSASGARNATLAYDPLGRLSSLASGGTTTRFLHDGDRLVAEYNDSTGAMTRRFAHGPGVDEPMIEDSGSALDCSATRFPRSDHQGSIIALADCWATRQAINKYDEYGNPQGGVITGRFGYTGQAWLPELGLYYYKARMYRPAEGVFMQTDPIGYDDQWNLYAYVGLDPVNKADPSGKSSILDDFFSGLTDGVYEARTGDVSGHNYKAGTAEVIGRALGNSLVYATQERGMKVGAQFGISARASQDTGKVINISRSRFPESAAHIERAQKAGQPRTLTVDRANAGQRRQESLAGMPTRSGKDRDEYPPAMFKEGGKGASRDYVASSDNRGAGASMGKQCTSVADGSKVTISVCD